MGPKLIKIGDKGFQAYMANLCDIFHDLRWQKNRVTLIRVYRNGVRLFDHEDKQVEAYDAQMLKKAQEAFNATFND